MHSRSYAKLHLRLALHASDRAQDFISRGLPASCTCASWSAAQDAVPPEAGPQLALAPQPGPLPRSRTSSLPNVLWCPGAAPRAPSEPAAPAAPVSPLLAAASCECLSAAPRLCACPSAGRCAVLHSASELPSRAARPRAGSASGRRPRALAVAPSASVSASASASLSLPVLADSAGLPEWCSSVLPMPIVSLAWERSPSGSNISTHQPLQSLHG